MNKKIYPLILLTVLILAIFFSCPAVTEDSDDKPGPGIISIWSGTMVIESLTPDHNGTLSLILYDNNTLKGTAFDPDAEPDTTSNFTGAYTLVTNTLTFTGNGIISPINTPFDIASTGDITGNTLNGTWAMDTGSIIYAGTATLTLQ